MTLQKTEILFDRIRNQIMLQPSAASLKIAVVSKNEQDKTAVQRLINQENESSLNLDLEIMASALDSLFLQSVHYPVSRII